MADPLAEAIREGMTYEDEPPTPDYVVRDAAFAVRAHLAAVLDAEATQWMHHFGHPSPALTAIDHLRAALGVAPTDREGG